MIEYHSLETNLKMCVMWGKKERERESAHMCQQWTMLNIMQDTWIYLLIKTWVKTINLSLNFTRGWDFVSPLPQLSHTTFYLSLRSWCWSTVIMFPVTKVMILKFKIILGYCYCCSNQTSVRELEEGERFQFIVLVLNWNYLLLFISFTFV